MARKNIGKYVRAFAVGIDRRDNCHVGSEKLDGCPNLWNPGGIANDTRDGPV
jgi:hypothetical protein